MKSTYFILIGFLVLMACRQKNRDASMARLLNNLESSEEVITNANQQIYWKIEDYERDPKTQEPSGHWMPMVHATRRISRDLVEYIRSLKGRQGKIDGEELMDKLTVYKKALKDSLDPSNYADSLFFHERLQQILPRMKEMIDTAFRLPEVDRLTISRIGIEALVLENRLLRDFNKYMGMIIEDVTRYDFVFNISSSYVKRGQQLVVTGGSGQFFLLRNQKMTIDGQVIKLDNGHIAAYTTIARGRPGKHIIPVKMEFTGVDGKSELISKNIEYEIAP